MTQLFLQIKFGSNAAVCDQVPELTFNALVVRSDYLNWRGQVNGFDVSVVWPSLSVSWSPLAFVIDFVNNFEEGFETHSDD